MDSPNGLVVPVIKNVEKKTVFEIAKEISRLKMLSNENKLGIEDLTGGTFTISSIGNVKI